MAEPATDTILVLNGPNLNMLGTREPEKYGHATLADVEALCRETAASFGLKADCRQSNREGELIDFIHEAHARKMKGIIINAGGYSHTSIALHDALLAVQIPTVEVHVTNIHARESFRHHSYTARAAFASLCGFGIEGYRLAIRALPPSSASSPKPDAPITQNIRIKQHGAPARRQSSRKVFQRGFRARPRARPSAR